MLFFNFLCIFYLIMLMNNTISKSINHDAKIDDSYETLNIFEYTDDSLKHDDKGTNKDKAIRKNEKATTELNVKPKEPSLSKTIASNIAKDAVTEINMILHVTSQVIQELWENIQKKIEDRKVKSKTANKSYYKVNTESNIDNNETNDINTKDGVRNITNNRNRFHYTKKKRKRDVFVSKTKPLTHNAEVTLFTKPMNIIPFKHIEDTTSNYVIYSTKTFEPKKLISNASDSKVETSVEKTNGVFDNEEAKIKTYAPYIAQTDKYSEITPDYTSQLYKDDFPGTAEIEALLNEIKARAIQMIVEQNPAITDIVTNTVTESTYDADPILNHNSRPMLVTTLVSVNIDDNFDNEAGTDNDTVVINNIEKPHTIAPRSLKAEAYTIASNLEDQVKREFATVYDTVRNKVYPQIQKELKESTDAIMHIITHKHKSKCSKHFKFNGKASISEPIKFTDLVKLTKSTVKSNDNRGTRQCRGTITNLEKAIHRHYAKTKKYQTTEHTIPALADEFAMLTLFEQLLSKTHEANVMNMLTTNDLPLKKPVGKANVKRNAETAHLKEDISKQTDGEGIPVESEDYESTDKSSIENDDKDQNISEDPSFEGLSKQISYSEYVNGYKNYLNFTKELNKNDQNFSSLVRYQAHRHHDVDDIGKYILNKIPKLSKSDMRNKRHFFDDSDAEDQDVTPKSDESWFKKHFYLFLEPGSKKKYHTSQTVSLKRLENNQDERTVEQMRPEKKNREVSKVTTEMAATDDMTTSAIGRKYDLDEMIKSLKRYKSKPTISLLPMYELNPGQDIKAPTERTEKQDESEATTEMKVLRSNIIEKLLRAKRKKFFKQKLRQGTEEPNDTENSIESPEIDDEASREKRNLKKDDKTHQSVNYVQKDEYEHRESTVPSDLFNQVALSNTQRKKHKNHGYVDVNLVSKPTAIVKLKGNAKNGKLRNFIKNLNFRSHKKKEKKKSKGNKRDIQRIQRFNPLKKIRDMFKKNDMYTPVNGYDSDYNIVTTRINAFKAVKYGQPLSAEEMSKLVPNITNDFDLGSIVKSNTDKMQWYPKDFMPESQPNQTSMESIPDTVYKINLPKTPTITKTKDVFKVNVKRIEPILDYEPNVPRTVTNNTRFTLNDIKVNVVSTNKNNIAYGSTVSQKSTQPTNYFKTISDHKTVYPIPYIRKFTLKPNANDITVKTAVTNVIKKQNNPHLDELPDINGINNPFMIKRKSVNDDSSQNVKFSSHHKTTNPVTTNKLTDSMMTRKRYNLQPDYFNDLILWHNDILNMDALSSQKAFLKDMDVSTPSVINMQQELYLIKEYLNSIDNSKPKKANNRVLPEDNIETTKAKKVDSDMKVPDRYLKAAGVLNDINNLYNMKAKAKGLKQNYDVESSKLKTALRNNERDRDDVRKDFTVGTTLAYDGAGNFITEDLDSNKKISNNYVGHQTGKFKETTVHPNATTNTPPQQYFSTPVPMTMDDFDNFLKNNEIDVQSVTTPLVDLWKFENKWFTEKSEAKSANKDTVKAKALKESIPKVDQASKNLISSAETVKKGYNINKDDNKKVLGHKSEVKTDTEYEMQYLDQLESNLINDYDFEHDNGTDDIDRVKRWDEDASDYLFNMEPYRRDVNTKYKRKLFAKNNMFRKSTTDQINKDTAKAKALKESIPKVDQASKNLISSAETVKKGYNINKDDNEKVLGHKSEVKTDTEYEMQYLDQLESNLNNDYDFEHENDIDRIKRWDEDASDYLFNMEPYQRDVNTKYKRKLFAKNNMFRKSTTDQIRANDGPMDGEVDITIINFEDTDKTMETPIKNLQFDYEILNSKEDNTDRTSAYPKTTKPTTIKKRDKLNNSLRTMHNDLLYKGIKEETTTPPYKEDSFKFSHLFNPDKYHYNDDQTETVEEHTKLPKTDKLLEDNLLPKRVQVSSYSLTYDVIYEPDSIVSKDPLESTTSLITVTGKSGRPNPSEATKERYSDSEIPQILKLIEIIEAVENYTRPSVEIHIDLPTYYIPNTGPTERITDTPATKSWSDQILRYISGIALVELISKLGNVKGDANVSATDGVDKDANASKVFSDVGGMNLGKEESDRVTVAAVEKLRFVRKAQSKATSHKTTKPRAGSLVYNVKQIEEMAENGTTQKTLSGRFKLFPFIHNKLMMLLKKKYKTETSKMIPETEPKTTAAIASERGTTKKVTNVKEGRKNLEPETNILAYDDSDLREASTVKSGLLDWNEGLSSINEGNIEFNRKEQVDSVTAKTKQRKPTKATTKKTKLEKRDTRNQDTYTARDVAALEVIVDLMKNTVNYEGNPAFYVQNPSQITKEIVLNPNTNAIQVHVAIPYSDNDKKRSSDHVKVRKVFSAKMYTPVDLEYQIHSFEFGTESYTSLTEGFCHISPGMYLLVENPKLAKGNFALKPLTNNVAIREVNVPTVKNIITKTTPVFKKIDATSIDRDFAKVTLSKDFVAAVNKQLIQLYGGINNVTESTARNNRKIRESNHSRHKIKSRINWKAVKRYFGHDRACSCHLKPNQTLCRACAASDAVMSELIFEFDNMAKYMSDHCTEIQTFFWMNPTGGRKLRDAVHKIDRNLHDYYKRVRGKCQGRTCQTFSTYIDKREFIKPVRKVNDYILDNLIEDINALAVDLENAAKLKINTDDKLKEKGENFIKTAGNCISFNHLNKRSNSDTLTRQSKARNMYSLDNINVNIICQPTASKLDSYKTTMPGIRRSFIPIMLNYDDDEVKSISKFNRLKNLFHRNKKKKTTKAFYEFNNPLFAKRDANVIGNKENKLNKRQIYTQVETPLIADTGGSFWKDYISKCSTRLMDFKKVIPEIKMNLIRGHNTPRSITTVKDTKTKHDNDKEEDITVSNNSIQPNDDNLGYTTIDSLSYSISKLSRLFDSLHDKQDVNEMSNATFTTTTKIPKHVKMKMHKTCKPKTKKTKMHIYTTTELVKTTHKHLKSNLKGHKTTTENNIAKLKENAIANVTDVGPKYESPISEKFDVPVFTTPKTKATIKHHFFDKFKSITIDILNGLDNGNYIFNESMKQSSTERTVFEKESTTEQILYEKEDMRKVRTPNSDYVNNYEATPINNIQPSKHVDSTLTTVSNPTIVIIEDYDSTGPYNELISIENQIGNSVTDSNMKETKPDRKFRSILLSILSYEKDRLKDDWKRFIYQNDIISTKDDMGDLSGSLYDLRATTERNKETSKPIPKSDYASGDYCILKKLEQLELKPPSTKCPTKGMINKLLDKFKIKVLDEKAGTKSHLKGLVERSIHKKSALASRKKKGKHKIKVPGHSENVTNAVTESTVLLSSPYPDQHLATGATTKPTSPKTTAVTESPSMIDVKTKTTARDSKKEKINDSEEACDPKTESHCICDLNATYDHILNLRRSMSEKEFEHYVKNITCHKYRKTPKYFSVKTRKAEFKKNLNVVVPQNGIKWDWIRNKRSSNDFDVIDNRFDNEVDEMLNDSDNSKAREEINNNLVLKSNDNDNQNIDYKTNDELGAKYENSLSVKETTEAEDIPDAFNEINIIEEGSDGDFGVENNVYFEKYYRRKGGIYSFMKKRRRKRMVDMRELVLELRNLPPFKPILNEIYVMLGDDIAIHCFPDTAISPNRHSVPELVWNIDRSELLKHDNVLLNGTAVIIKNVGERNVGNYTCSKGTSMHRTLKLTVITLPQFHVVFIPLYSTEDCSYDDLKTLRQLGPVMSEHGCSVRIDEPVCIEDKEGGSSLIRATGVLTPCPRSEVDCSVECRRDLQCSMALLCADNAPALASVGVLLSKDGVNKTLRPSLKSNQQLIVTHTLRKTDLSGHKNYHKLSLGLSPGDIDIVVTCPAGYYLKARQKICAVCPPDTYSSAGDNVCSACAAGNSSPQCGPGIVRGRRYEWCPPPCVYYMVACGALCACVICALGARAHVTSRGRSDGGGARGEGVQNSSRPCEAPRRASPRAFTPSRVILARFFRGSLSSSKDSQETRKSISQETKFEQWKKKNIPPPLPPIDFDLW